MKKLLTFIAISVLISSFISNMSCICSRTSEQTLDEIASWVASTRQLAILSDIEYEFVTTDDRRQQLIDQFDIENNRGAIRGVPRLRQQQRMGPVWLHPLRC